MADKWRTATGNYSTAAQWNGGTLPQPGDNIYANNFTCTIDVAEALMGLWSNFANAGLGVAAGGQFIIGPSVPGGTFTFAGNMECGGTILFSMTTAAVHLVHSSGTGIASTTSTNRFLIDASPSTGSGSLTLGGTYQNSTVSSNYVARVNASTNGSFGLIFNNCNLDALVSGAALIYTVSGSQGIRTVSGRINRLKMAAGNAIYGLDFAGFIEGSFNITELQYGPGNAAINYNGTQSAGRTIAVVIDTITRLAAHVGSTTNGMFNATNGCILDVTCPPVTMDNVASNWVSSLNVSRVNYRGNVKVAPTSSAFRVSSPGSIIEHFGELEGSDVVSSANAVSVASFGAMVILDKVKPGLGGFPNLQTGIRFKATTEFRALNEAGSTVALVASTSVGDPPAVTDVREGVQYHFDTLTGTCKVPGASSVAAGVEVDDTVGTALVTSAALLSAMGLDDGNLTELIEALPTLEEIQENAVFVLPISYQQQSQLQGAWIRRAIGDASPMELRALKDANGVAINLSGKTLKLYVTTSGKTPTVVQTFNHADLTVFGDNDSVQFTPSTTLVGTVRKLLLSLRVVTTTEQEIVPGGIDIYRTAWTS